MRNKSFHGDQMRPKYPENTTPDLDHVARVYSAHNAVSEALTSYFGYPFERQQPGDFRLDLLTPNRKWRSQILISDAGVLRLFVFLTDDLYRPTRSGFVSELTHRLNEDIAVAGSFAMNVMNGCVTYRQAIDFRQEAPTTARIIDFLNSVSFPLTTWERSFAYVDKVTVTSAQALEVALLFAQIEMPQVSRAVKKLAFRVLSGGNNQRPSDPPNLSLR